MTSFNSSSNVTSFPSLAVSSVTPRLTQSDIFVLGCLLGLMIVFSIAGNVLVILAIVTDRRLRTSSNYFYVSLALADTLVAALVMTLALANDLTGRWLFGSALCNVWLSADVMGSTASILHLSAISLDRYAHVRDPYMYERLVTSRSILLFIAAIWLLSAFISFIPIHLGWHRAEDLTQSGVEMTSEVCVLALNRMYAICSSLVSFYVPCIIMIALYGRLYLLARQHLRHIRSTLVIYPQAFKRSLEGETPPPIDRSPSHGVADPPSDHKAAITLGVIMGVFLVCWTPFFTANIIVAFCEHCVPNSVYHVVTWLGYFNSSLNPVIYPIFNQDFRRSFSRLLAPLFVCSSNSRVNGIVSGGGGGGRRGISSVPPHRHTSCLPRVVHVGESASI